MRLIASEEGAIAPHEGPLPPPLVHHCGILAEKENSQVSCSHSQFFAFMPGGVFLYWTKVRQLAYAAEYTPLLCNIEASLLRKTLLQGSTYGTRVRSTVIAGKASFLPGNCRRTVVLPAQRWRSERRKCRAFVRGQNSNIGQHVWVFLSRVYGALAGGAGCHTKREAHAIGWDLNEENNYSA